MFVDISATIVVGQTHQRNCIKNSYFAQYKLDTANNEIIFPIFVMNKPFKCCGIIYFMDECIEKVSRYGDGRKIKAKSFKLDRGFPQANKSFNK